MPEKKSLFRLEYSTMQNVFHIARRDDPKTLANTNTFQTIDDGWAAEDLQRAFCSYFRAATPARNDRRFSFSEVQAAWERFKEHPRQLYPEWSWNA